jgi:hypothetical protein
MNDGYFPAWYHVVEAFFLLIAGAILALAIGTVVLGGDIRSAVADESRAALAAAHEDTCEKLGLGPVRAHPEFPRCLNLLIQLHATHSGVATSRHAPY